MPVDSNVLAGIRNELEKKILGAYPEADAGHIKFETPPSPELGHLSLICFFLSKLLRKPPAKIAEEISLLSFPPEVEKVELKGPYLNFFFNADRIFEKIKPLADTGDFGTLSEGAGKSALVEFSSPNTNKPLHLGHARNNMLGFSLSNLFEKAGYRVSRVNLVNDRGIHICKSMLAYQLFGNGVSPQKSGKKGDHFVGEYYVKFDQESQGDPSLSDKAQAMLIDWENGEPGIRKLWQEMNGWVMEGFKKTYGRMGIEFDKFYFESDLYAGGKELVLEALEKGICQKEDNGAVSIDLEAEKLGKKILLRGDGTSVYMTQDISTTVKKNQEFSPDHMLFVVGNEQDNHFRVLFKVIEKFGYAWASTCEHVSYGMISLPEGNMKSRQGNVVDIDDLLDEIKGLALEEIIIRRPELKESDEAADLAEHIGQAAVKFMILKATAEKNFVFDSKESLSFDGMTGPYLQYTHARLSSLLRKSEDSGLDAADDESVSDAVTYDWNEEERQIIILASRYPDSVSVSVKNRNPAELANYIYNLARNYNRYYYATPILKGEPTAVSKRLNLAGLVKFVLADALKIMGIEPLERM